MREEYFLGEVFIQEYGVEHANSLAYSLNNEENVESSIYGHSLRVYKGNAYIFGGTRL